MKMIGNLEVNFFLYFRYGFHLMSSSYWFVPKSDTVKNIFTKLRKDHKVRFISFFHFFILNIFSDRVESHITRNG